MITLDKYTKCAVCERPLKEGQAFSRIKYEDDWVHLCCPLCFDTFNKNRKLYVLRNQALEAAEKIKRKQKK